jgi:hypothetical protein
MPPVIFSTAAAHASLSLRSIMRQWNSQAWRPQQCVGHVGHSVPVPSLQFSGRPVGFMLRLIIAKCPVPARV